MVESFRVVRSGEWWTAKLYNEHGEEVFETAPAACHLQAAANAVRGGGRPLKFVGVFEWADGELIETTGALACQVPRGAWEDRVHRWTHEVGMAAMSRRHRHLLSA